MNVWVLYVLVYGGVIAAAAVGLALHLRLVRFFDLGWALWTMVAALVGVYTARWSSSIILGIIFGGVSAAVLGILEDGFILRKALTSFIPPEVIERFTFSGALGSYLMLTSITEALGFRDQEMVPATQSSLWGLSVVELVAASACWGSLLVLAAIQFLPLGLRIRALLEDSSISQLFGLRVPALSGLIGGIAGGLSGISSSSFGLLYRAHYSTGLALMLLAVIPCILVNMNSSLKVIYASLAIVALIAAIRFAVGYNEAEYLIYGGIVILLVIRPQGLAGKSLREV